MNSLISIIIPTYNRSNLLGETLNSVLAQTYQNWECIVVDDGSTDHTANLMEFYCAKDSRIRYHHRPKNKPKGANACRNYGYEISKGEFIKWFDSDDLLHRDYLWKVMNVLENKTDLVICNAKYFNEDFSTLLGTFRNISNSENILWDYLTSKININIQSVIWRKETLCNLQFDEKLKRAQELDFHFRILKEKAINALFLDESLVSIRAHTDSITGGYNAGNLASIKSSLRVGGRIMRYASSSEATPLEKNQCVKLYLNALRDLYKHGSLFDILKELFSISIEVKNVKYRKWRIKLIGLILIYKVTSREHQLKQHLYSLKF